MQIQALTDKFDATQKKKNPEFVTAKNLRSADESASFTTCEPLRSIESKKDIYDDIYAACDGKPEVDTKGLHEQTGVAVLQKLLELFQERPLYLLVLFMKLNKPSISVREMSEQLKDNKWEYGHAALAYIIRELIDKNDIYYRFFATEAKINFNHKNNTTVESIANTKGKDGNVDSKKRLADIKQEN